MLCEKFWKEEARVHFTVAAADGAQERAYCLSCAQREHLSWLLAWGYGLLPNRGSVRLMPQVLPLAIPTGGRRSALLVGLAVVRCQCGCCVVVGAELPDAEHLSGFLPRFATTTIQRSCHCGRNLSLPVPLGAAAEAQPPRSNIIIASVDTCALDEHRRCMLALDQDMRAGRTTWATFAIRN